ncbi:hypothetical protein HID58_034602 [Brassica napus]|uniref:Uncharacterized protein n=1 Tax=Brassica napus TaxID=3708 RepID=A0ABQ8C2I8_BRANA|nr:hypothetical protein HID58_034602 [Brassica napus]
MDDDVIEKEMTLREGGIDDIHHALTEYKPRPHENNRMLFTEFSKYVDENRPPSESIYLSISLLSKKKTLTKVKAENELMLSRFEQNSRLANLMSAAARAFTVTEFNKKFIEIQKISPNCAAYLVDIERRKLVKQEMPTL